MSIKWNKNGIIVQDVNETDDCQTLVPYMGVGRFSSWPLSAKSDKVSTKLTAEAEEKWFGYYYGESFSLAVIPSMEYIESYIGVCKKKNIKIRVLYVETNRSYPKWNGPELNTMFLGYDYATSQDFFSVIFDDLYGENTPPMLTKFKTSLNSNGLFSTEDTLLAYIETRHRAIEQGYDLEKHGDFCMYRIWSVMT